MVASLAWAQQENPQEALQEIQENIAKIQPELERLSTQKSLLEREQMNLSERLVIITEKIRATQERIDDLEEEIKTADMREQALTADLSSRKAEVAKILAAMGRLSISPATPLGAVEDEEKTVHTALILRNLTQELEKQADELVDDLKLLRDMRENLKKNRRNLARERLQLDADSGRLAILVETRQNNIKKTAKDLGKTKEKLKQLSQKEKTIEDLITKIELEEKKRQEQEKKLELAKIKQAQEAAKQFKDKKNNQPKVDKTIVHAEKRTLDTYNQDIKLHTLQEYLAQKGQLLRPIAGKVVHQYGMPDKTGKKRTGITIKSVSNGIVTAPVNARVIFADNFKRQGSIIILNPVGKYYIVLSGLGVINVSPGQNVAKGEPIGRMKSGIGQRNLYVEFRKDRRTIDPNKWLSYSSTQNVASSQ